MIKLDKYDRARYLDTMASAYVVCALRATMDCDDQGNEIRFDDYEPSRMLLARARRDCRAFLRLAGAQVYQHDASQVGHDFWLTRERHGAGFWDRGKGEYYEKTLTDLAHSFGDCHLWLSRGKVMCDKA